MRSAAASASDASFGSIAPIQDRQTELTQLVGLARHLSQGLVSVHVLDNSTTIAPAVPPPPDAPGFGSIIERFHATKGEGAPPLAKPSEPSGVGSSGASARALAIAATVTVPRPSLAVILEQFVALRHNAGTASAVALVVLCLGCVLFIGTAAALALVGFVTSNASSPEPLTTAPLEVVLARSDNGREPAAPTSKAALAPPTFLSANEDQHVRLSVPPSARALPPERNSLLPTPARSPQGSLLPASRRPFDGQRLCPELVVPQASECTLLIPRVHQTSGDEIVIDDIRGSPVLRVSVGAPSTSRGRVQGLLTLLAIQEDEVFAYGMAEDAKITIRHHTEQDFAQLSFDREAGAYVLTLCAGGKLYFRGDFVLESFHLQDERDRLLAVVQTLKNHGADPKRQLRVGPLVDAGLVVLCILGVDILETANVRNSVRRDR